MAGVRASVAAAHQRVEADACRLTGSRPGLADESLRVRHRATETIGVHADDDAMPMGQSAS
jgi:hypothetical protein